jgi:diacylglycerol kinase family enzyme
MRRRNSMDRPSSLRFAVVANASSGAASLLGEAALHALVTDSLGPQLASCEIAEPEFIDMALDRAFSSAADVIIVIGGDGTCRAAAKFGRQTDKVIGFLPGGTMNLLPSRHWPQMDLSVALVALGSGAYEISTIDVGKVNDEIFLIAAAFGAAPTLARLREAHRSSETLSESITNLLKIPKVLPHLLRPSVRLEAKGVSRRHLAALAIVLGDADFALGRPDTDADTQMFEVVGAQVKSPWAFITVMARAHFDPNWRDDSKITTTAMKEGKVYSRSRAIAMTLDGEIVRLASPAQVTLLANGLRVLVSAPAPLQHAAQSARPAMPHPTVP